MDVMCEIVYQATYSFSGSMKCTNRWMKCAKWVEYEFFEIGWNVSMNTPEFALSQL